MQITEKKTKGQFQFLGVMNFETLNLISRLTKLKAYFWL